MQHDRHRTAPRLPAVDADQRVVGPDTEERRLRVVDRAGRAGRERHRVTGGRPLGDAEPADDVGEGPGRLELDVPRAAAGELLDVLAERVVVERGVALARVALGGQGRGARAGPVREAQLRPAVGRLQRVVELVGPAVGPLGARREAPRRGPGGHGAPRRGQPPVGPADAGLVLDVPAPADRVHGDGVPHLLGVAGQQALPPYFEVLVHHTLRVRGSRASSPRQTETREIDSYQASTTRPLPDGVPAATSVAARTARVSAGSMTSSSSKYCAALIAAALVWAASVSSRTRRSRSASSAIASRSRRIARRTAPSRPIGPRCALGHAIVSTGSWRLPPTIAWAPSP